MGRKFKTVILGNGFDIGLFNALKMANNDARIFGENYIFNLESFLIETQKNIASECYCSLFREIFLNSTGLYFDKAIDEMSDNCTDSHKAEDTIKVICDFETNFLEIILRYANNKFLPGKKLLWLSFITDIIKFSSESSKNFIREIDNKLTDKEKEECLEAKKEFESIKKCVWVIYEAWFYIVEKYIKAHSYLEKTRAEYYKSFRDRYINDNPIILTTNYNIDIKSYFPETEYLHGHFDEELDKGKINIFTKPGETPSTKILFAMLGLDKNNRVNESSSSYYDDSFFKNFDNRDYGEVLVYGLSFVKSKPNKLTSLIEVSGSYNTIIDEHIIVRLSSLIDAGRCNSVVINYYSDIDQRRYKKNFEDFKASKDINVYKNYETGKFKIEKM